MNSTIYDTKDCCAVLLRGGESRRMGRDKALLQWRESTFLETIASRLDFLDEKYLSLAASGAASARNDLKEDAAGQTIPAEKAYGREGPGAETSGIVSLSAGWIRLPDLIPDCGPLGGIYTALSACRAEWALVASCDIPAVERSIFAMLLDNRTDNADIIFPLTSDGRMHLTCALYRKSLAPILRKQIEKGDNRLRALTELCRAKAVLVERQDLLWMLSNINTEEELDRIRKGADMENEKKVKVDYNEKMLRQQYEPMSPQEQYRLKMEALNEIRESGIDYCSCPEQCPHHGKCRECVLIHRGHRDHLPYCMWDMINEKLYAVQRLTEGSLLKWTPHEDGFIPRQYGCPPDCAQSEDFCGQM